MGLMLRGATPDAGTGRGARRIEVGLVNLMPDAALAATERQFARLLAAAAGGAEVRLHLFSLEEVPRSAACRADMAGRYGDLAALKRARLDGLIVTGAEPVAPSLEREPYWRPLTRVIDWAERNTASTLFSCLAAHAAVLHLDGVARRRLPRKRSGLYACGSAGRHPLLASAPAEMRVPHSRWNDLDEADLARHGYEILTRSPEAGVDSFAKRWTSRFVFLQGHPEYDADTLFREFRRDLRRFLDGEAPGCPQVPVGYFDAETDGRLRRFRDAAERDPAAVGAFPEVWTVDPAPLRAWRATSRGLFADWLGGLAEPARA